MKRPESVTLSAQEGEAMMARLAAYAPSMSDCEVLIQVLRWHFWLVWTLQEAKLSLKRLRNLLFGNGPTPPTSPVSEASSVLHHPVGAGEGAGESWLAEAGASGAAEAESEFGPGALAAAARAKPTGGHRPGTGRLRADAYEGAERIECRHEELAVGQRCPVCGQGRLYALPPGVEIRIDGNALLSAMRYEVEKLRCSACGQVFTAKLPDEVGEEKYSARARAVLAVGRYYLGLPLYRVEGYQAMLGVPVADATQWDQIERVADCGYVVFTHLERLAAQGELIYQDDTSVRILSLIEANRQAQAHAEALGVAPSKERTGMYTTALVVRYGARTICLYYSGRAHAGENLAALLSQREADQGKPLVMSDALISNEADEQTLIR